MPQQELFFEERAEDRLIVVLKTYDQSYAREVFGNVDDAASAEDLGSFENPHPGMDREGTVGLRSISLCFAQTVPSTGRCSTETPASTKMRYVSALR
jgi:hypothetical protein